MTFLEQIVKDIDWRVSELATLTTLPYRYKIAEIHVQTLLFYSVPAVYALWEGFVKYSFTQYVRYINTLNISINMVNENVLTHALTNSLSLNLENSITNFNSKKRYICAIHTLHMNPLVIPEEIPTHSNVNYEIINDILLRFNLSELDPKYKRPLNKLLHYRNSLAHGERILPVTKKTIEEFGNLLQDLMTEIYSKIEDGYNNKTYLK